MPKATGVYKASNGTWYFKVRTGRDPTPAKWKQVTRRGFPSAAAASEARRDLAERRQPQPSAANRRLTVSDLVRRYHAEEEAMGRLSERTALRPTGLPAQLHRLLDRCHQGQRADEQRRPVVAC